MAGRWTGSSTSSSATELSTSTESGTAEGFAARYGIPLIVLGALFYSTGPVLARSSDTSGVLISFWRLWFGVALFGLGLAVHALSGRSVGNRAGWRLAILAGTAFSFNQVLFFSAIKRTSTVDASLMSTLSPIFVAILAVRLFNERPGMPFRLWSLVAIVGAVVVVLGSSSGPEGNLLGMLMAVGSTLAFSAFFIISKRARDDIPVVAFLTGVMGTAAVWVSVFVLATGGAPLDVSGTDRWRALAMATIPGALGHIASTWPLRHIPANVPPLVRLSGPVLSGALAWLFLGEGVGWIHVIGGAIILGGQAGAIMSQAGQNLVADARAR